MMRENGLGAWLAPAMGLLMGLVVTTAVAAAQERNMAHMHMGHVMAGWQDTPQGRGLLPTAIAEADVALQHAGLAKGAGGDLQAIQAHAGHTLHALDPDAVEAGPGIGYGLIKAAGGARQHISLAAEAAGASGAVKAHAEHVSTALANVVDWAERAKGLAESIRGAGEAAAAAESASQLAELTDWIRNGRDADGDGEIGWGEGEGGLAQARRHMQLMYQAEKLSLE